MVISLGCLFMYAKTLKSLYIIQKVLLMYVTYVLHPAGGSRIRPDNARQNRLDSRYKKMKNGSRV